jgi:ribosomal protein S24E
MEIKIIEEKMNPLFSRKEVKLEVKTEIVPSQDEAKKIIADKFSCNEEFVRLRKIDARYGVQSFTIIADIYDSKEEFLRVVKKTKQEIDAEKKAEEEKLKAELEVKEAAKAAKEAEEIAKEEVEEKTE